MSLLYKRCMFLVFKESLLLNVRSINVLSCKLYNRQSYPGNQLLSVQCPQHDFIDKRFKYTRKKEVKKSSEDSDDSDSDDDDSPLEKNAKIVTSYLSIPRVDAVIKAGLGIARNKSEVLFLENKIRINGYKVPKKSHRVHIGDEVDIIKASAQGTDVIHVSRVILTSAREVDDREELRCKLKVFKHLEIENYSEHPYKSQQNDT